MTELVGRWSMLDVFVVTVLVALVRLGYLTTIEAGTGIVYFAMVVVITMIAAMTFDPRLIWDALENNDELSPTDTDVREPIPEPEIQRGRRFSIVWLIPLLAAVIGVWLAVKTIRETGPTITIVFKSAEGLVSGKTEIKSYTL